MIENILLVLLVALLSAKLLGGLSQKIGLDSSIGELITGIVLGSFALNLIEARQIETFALLGSVLILFVAGLKQNDIAEVFEDKKAMQIGIVMLLATTAIMTAFFYFVLKMFGMQFSFIQSLVLGIAFAIIDIGVPAKIFISKGLIALPIGKITIRSAIINILAGLALFTIVTLFFNPSLVNVALKLVQIFLFVVITVLLVYFLSNISRFVFRLHVEEAEISLALVLVLALAYFSDLIGFSSVLGAFIAGAIVARLPYAETTSFSQKIKSLAFGLFIPLFFVWFGLEIDLGYILKNIGVVLLIFIVYALVRFAAMYAFMNKYKIKTKGLISSSMLSVDVESLVILLVATQLGIFIDDVPLSLFAPSVFLSTLIIVLLVAFFSRAELKKQKAFGKTEVKL